MTKGIHQQPMKEGSEEGTGLSVEENVQIYGNLLLDKVGWR